MQYLQRLEILYRDAISLDVNGWMKEYNVPEEHKEILERFNVNYNGKFNSETPSTIHPRMLQGWVRMFLLGIQIASQEVTDEPPPNKIAIDTEPNNQQEPLCFATHDSREIIVNEKFIRDNFRSANSNAGHMLDYCLDPFQHAFYSGVEEALHIESYKDPLKLQEYMAFDRACLPIAKTGEDVARNYTIIPAERDIHEDIIQIRNVMEICNGFAFNPKTWDSFMEYIATLKIRDNVSENSDSTTYLYHFKAKTLNEIAKLSVQPFNIPSFKAPLIELQSNITHSINRYLAYHYHINSQGEESANALPGLLLYAVDDTINSHHMSHNEGKYSYGIYRNETRLNHSPLYKHYLLPALKDFENRLEQSKTGTFSIKRDTKGKAIAYEARTTGDLLANLNRVLGEEFVISAPTAAIPSL